MRGFISGFSKVVFGTAFVFACLFAGAALSVGIFLLVNHFHI
jgi:hypothetical protein